MGNIQLKKMQFYGYHGLHPEENKLGQRFIVDVKMFLNVEKAGKSDQMTDSIDYGRAYEVVKEVVEGEAKNLLEAIAETLASQLFKQFAILNGCLIKVTKPDPPIHGHYESVSVEIYRERKQ